MRKYGGLLVVLFLSTAFLSADISLGGLSVQSNDTSINAVLSFKGTVPVIHDFTLSSPPRIVLDFENTRYMLTRRMYAVNAGNVLRIRGSQFKNNPAVARLVIDLTKKAHYSLVKGANTISIVVSGRAQTKGNIVTAKPKKYAVKKATVKPATSTGSAPEPSKIVQVKDIMAGKKYFYKALGKRDPFKPITEAEISADTLLDMAKAKLIGTIEDSTGYVALVEDKEEKGFILRPGDRIKNGRVISVRKNLAIFAVSDFGFTRTIILKIEKEK